MSKFATVSFYVLGVCSAVAGGLSLVCGYGWEQALGFAVFAVGFANAGDYFRNH